jgi:hypothetical protein
LAVLGIPEVLAVLRRTMAIQKPEENAALYDH